MQGEILYLRLSTANLVRNSDGLFDCGTSSSHVRTFPSRHLNLNLITRYQSVNGSVDLAPQKVCLSTKNLSVRSVTNEDQGFSPDDEEDDELCPVECVREFKSDEEFLSILEKAKETNALVVVDFYRTSCGSCKYIEQGFSKLCKASGDDDAPVIFLKHNVMDEYDEQSEVADRLRIKKVPLFHFYKNGTLLEAFATRDKEKITEAISRYISYVPQDV